MDVAWSPQQRRALEMAFRWLDDPTAGQVFYLAGYAGTGKSTLARAINDYVGGYAVCGAYTGKAASVMARKGLPGATTIHRMIYTPTGSDTTKLDALRDELAVLEGVAEPDRATAARADALRSAVAEAEAQAKQPSFLLKSREECDLALAPLCILDECSMIGERLGQDVLSFGCRTLVLGDRAQLPPVKAAGYFTDRRPDYELTEIHRQAQESPILRLATLAREGKSIPYGEFGDASVVRSIDAQLALGVDQVLCGTNLTRQSINMRHRQLAGIADPMPRAGEKLVCIRNDHQQGLLNGTQWRCEEDVEGWEPGDGAVPLTISPLEGGAPMTVPADPNIFLDEANKPAFGSHAQQFTWGDCLTVHKSQGSQWGSVALFDNWPRRDSHTNWLYTGITRAAEKLILVRP